MIAINESTAAVIDLAAVDSGGGSGLTYSISGGVDFGIDSNTGIASFADAPVVVTNLGGLTSKQDLIVTVTDVAEPPEIVAFTMISINEATTADQVVSGGMIWTIPGGVGVFR